MPFTAKSCALFFLLSYFNIIDGATDPIIVRGNKLYNARTKERFFIKGITYEYAVSDTYYSKFSKSIFHTQLKDFKFNAVRLYDVNPDESYDLFMKDAADLGLYVILSGSPDNKPYYGKYRYSTLDRNLGPNGEDMTKSCYPALLLEYGKKIIKKFAAYDNFLALLVGNEILQVDLTAAACVKQYAADLKSWMRVNGKKIRLVPLAYAAADSTYGGDNADDYHALKIQGLLCGDRMSNGMTIKSIDIYFVNEYRWCPGSTFAEAYQRFLFMAKGLPIVIAFGEYGCKLPGGKARDWGMVSYLYDAPTKTEGFSEVFTGGFAYSYGQAKLSSDSVFPMFLGGSMEITGKPSDQPSADYKNLFKAFQSHSSFSEKASWNSDSICKWVPKNDKNPDPSNKRVVSDGWLVPSCEAPHLKVKPGDTWVTETREGAICTDKGTKCDVTIPSAVGTTQEEICGDYVVESGGGSCKGSSDCGANAQCLPGEGGNVCKCLACYTGADCSIKDTTTCSTLSSSPNAPKYIFTGVGIFLGTMLIVYVTLGIQAKRKANVLFGLNNDMKARGSERS